MPAPRILVRPFLPSLISAFGLIRTSPIRFHPLVFCISEPSRIYCVLQPPCAPHVPPAITLIFRGNLSLPESGWTRIVCRFGFGWINGNLNPFAAPDPPLCPAEAVGAAHPGAGCGQTTFVRVIIAVFQTYGSNLPPTDSVGGKWLRTFTIDRCWSILIFWLAPTPPLLCPAPALPKFAQPHPPPAQTEAQTWMHGKNNVFDKLKEAQTEAQNTDAWKNRWL